MEVKKQIETLEENIICLKAAIINAKKTKQQAVERYKMDKDSFEKDIQESLRRIENLKENDEDWEPMTDMAVDRWIEEEIEKD